jgi:pimeloyl-ACP methyl ester carboxylesterase
VVEAGALGAPPVLLLHGFPDHWWCWRHLLPALAAAGFRAVAPDLRGYARSDKPRAVRAYRLDRLAGDVRALLDELSPAPVPVVGHDWGGAAAWWAALLFPERIARLAIVNAPHPLVFRRALWSDPDQRRRSRYFAYFQLPYFPERKLAEDGFRRLRRMLLRMSRAGTFTEADLDRSAAAWARPGALSGMLAWYRAALRHPPPRPPRATVEPPVALVWGMADAALSPRLVEPSAARCREVEVLRIEGAGHWAHLEEPERVSEHLLRLLGIGAG